jgi:catechol-2,3-dioxygenase
MVAPSKFAHVVYSTHRFEEMIAWYGDVFEAKVQHRDDKLAFLTYDEEHHRFAFMNLGAAPAGSTTKRGQGPGVHHLAYTWDDLPSLLDVYRRLREIDIRPKFNLRHGPTLSMYYADPDGNRLEFQIDLLDADAANDFMHGAAFGANPIGEPFDPDELLARFDAGEAVDELVFRSDQPAVALARSSL